jgi:hypothetical protein
VDEADSYILETSPNGVSNWSTVDTVDINSYQHTQLNADTDYYYRVTPQNAGGTGVTSDIFFDRTPPITGEKYSSPVRVQVDVSEPQYNGIVRFVPNTGNPVTNGNNLQTAIDNAIPGDIIELEAGVDYVGGIELPVKSNP